MMYSKYGAYLLGINFWSQCGWTVIGHRVGPLHCIIITIPCVLYLVDPASNDMLVSKIKPCMYMFRPSYG